MLFADLYARTVGFAVKDDTSAIRECTAAIKMNTDEILARVGSIRRAAGPPQGHGRVEQWIESMAVLSSYAGTTYQETVADLNEIIPAASAPTRLSDDVERESNTQSRSEPWGKAPLPARAYAYPYSEEGQPRVQNEPAIAEKRTPIQPRQLTSSHPGGPQPHEMVTFSAATRKYRFISMKDGTASVNTDTDSRYEVFWLERRQKEALTSGIHSRLVVLDSERGDLVCNYYFWTQQPVYFQSGAGGTGAGSSALRVLVAAGKAGDGLGTVVLTFDDEQTSTRLRHAILGRGAGNMNGEALRLTRLGIRLTNFDMSTMRYQKDVLGLLSKENWQSLWVPRWPQTGSNLLPSSSRQPTIHGLCILSESANGIHLLDRLDAANTILPFNLEADKEHQHLIRIRFPPQGTTTLLAPLAYASKDHHAHRAVNETLRIIRSHSTIRACTFTTRQDLHTFQLAMTGFRVLFDECATRISIKSWFFLGARTKIISPADLRIQVVQGGADGCTRVVVFFMPQPGGFFGPLVFRAEGLLLQATIIPPKQGGKKGDIGSLYGIRMVGGASQFPSMPKSRWQREGHPDEFVCLDAGPEAGNIKEVSLAFYREEGMQHGLNCCARAELTCLCRS
jgi:hypothetical protein